jgi:hypothetical protein
MDTVFFFFPPIFSTWGLWLVACGIEDFYVIRELELEEIKKINASTLMDDADKPTVGYLSVYSPAAITHGHR